MLKRLSLLVFLTGQLFRGEAQVSQAGYIINTSNILVPAQVYPMDSSEFQSVKSLIASQSWEDEKLKFAKLVVSSNRLFTYQVLELMLHLSFDDTRMSFAKYSLDHVVDQNYFILSKGFRNTNSMNSFNDSLLYSTGTCAPGSKWVYNGTSWMYNNPAKPGRLPFNKEEFEVLRRLLLLKPFDDDKLKIIARTLTSGRLLCSQVASLIQLLDIDDNKLKLAKLAANNTFDSNYYLISQALAFKTTRAAYIDYVLSMN